MMSLTLGMVAPIGAMWILLWRTGARACGAVTCMCAACALGLGSSSLLWWLLLQLPIQARTTLVRVDLTIWTGVVIALAAWWLRGAIAAKTASLTIHRSGPGVAPSDVLARPRNQRPAGNLFGLLVALAVFLPACTLAIVAFTATSAVEPHGTWDAWAIWNYHARFLFYGSPSSWQAAFASLGDGADYPLLVPGVIARCWTLVGREGVATPIALAAFFAAGSVLVAGVSIRRESTIAKGLLTSGFIVASPAFVRWAPSQDADIPLALYMLLTFVFLTAGMRSERSVSLWSFAGLSAGLAAWTKNEGAVFLVVVLLASALWAARRPPTAGGWRSILAFVAGAAAPALIVASFKLWWAPPSALIVAPSPSYVLATINGSRLWVITTAIGRELWHGGADVVGIFPLLVVYAALAGTAPGGKAGARFTLFTLALQLCAYAAVFALTPIPLAWQLDRALGRLIVQLTPSVVWGAMLMTAARYPFILSVHGNATGAGPGGS